MKDVAELVDATDDLLGAMRLMYWIYHKPDQNDTSYEDAMHRAETALKKCGRDVIPYEEFAANVETILTEDVPI